jgi:hypothetical protein
MAVAAIIVATETAAPRVVLAAEVAPKRKIIKNETVGQEVAADGNG